ncbi:zinc-binding dehydrogenase [Streptomyces phaeofaciens JCM 4814]|uniref:NADPH:quinone reductase n=1 Tax=Streptomyces phaeofaciens TaxID=68254 RepID=A0A918HNK5_9ACTN|nr:zinc-binding dehydrogenase [Streptomyces phaeofaciens]GGT85535.1 NADPH:quinone reductase [Streptomyces phaeofaciens]
MRAAQVKAFGGPEVLATVELTDPVPGPGEVLIEVSHADTIFVETQVRAGLFRDHFPVVPPYVPGGGVSGTVAAVGAGVDAGWAGRRVVSWVDGSYAERATAPVTALVPVPDGLDLRTAAALVHDGVTASGLLERTSVSPGDRVLVLGASGGMGTLLVQLARARGATVVAAARGEEKLALVTELGAHATVDVSAPGWVERAREALGGGAEVVLDGVGGELGAAALPLTVDLGRFSAHGAPSGAFAPLDPEEVERRDITVFGIADLQFPRTDVHRLTAHALAEAAAGRLRTVIGAVFPLTETEAAHRAVEGRGAVGKVVLDVSGEL